MEEREKLLEFLEYYWHQHYQLFPEASITPEQTTERKTEGKGFLKAIEILRAWK